MRKKRTLYGAVIVAAVCLCIGCEQPLNDAKPVITITTQPAAATVVKQGEITGSLSVAASVTENAALSYQWYSNTTNSTTGGTAVSGATSTDFTIPTDLGVGTYYYFCEVSADGAASVRSGVALVTVIDSSAGTGITITTQPKAATTVIQGSITGSLSVAASVGGGGTPSYQWYSTTSDSTTDGTAVSGATNATFTIPTDLGLGTHYYYCEVSAEGADSVFSSIAKVTVSDGSDVTVITITTQPKAETIVIQDSTTGSITDGASEDDATSADFTIPDYLFIGKTGGKRLSL